MARRAEGAGGAPESTWERGKNFDPTSLVELRRTSFGCWIGVSHEGAKSRRREDGGEDGGKMESGESGRS